MDSLLKSGKIYLFMSLVVGKKEITTEFFEEESTPKLQLLLLRVQRRFFPYHFSCRRIKRIRNSCYWLKFHINLFCFVESGCIRFICGGISLYWDFCDGSANFCFRKLRLSFLLLFLVFFFLILPKYKLLCGYFPRILHG